MEKKEDVFFEICNAVLKLEVQKGHLLWKISDVSRISGITRSLIYYYFGKEKENILNEAWHFMLQLFYENAGKEEPLTIEQRMQIIIEHIKKMPYLMVLFILEKGKETEFGQKITKAEKNLLQKFENEFPHLSKTEIKKVYLLELGCLVYQLDPQELAEIFKFTRR